MTAFADRKFTAIFSLSAGVAGVAQIEDEDVDLEAMSENVFQEKIGHLIEGVETALVETSFSKNLQVKIQVEARCLDAFLGFFYKEKMNFSFDIISINSEEV